ncbi:MAG: hypothetical protein Q4C98_10365 [Capnocytophaga sp.]|nr:hypothetical protein [Capnocytophaga sp.]
MNKNAKKFLKLYEEKREERSEKFGEIYPPMSWEEFHYWNNYTFEKHLQSFKNQAIKTKLYISLLGRDVQYFAFWEAFSKADFQVLNNAIWQESRTEILDRAITASGTTFTGFHLDAIFRSFATNDFEPLGAFFPAEIPLLTARYYPEVVANILKSLLHKQEENLQKSLQLAEKFLTKKLTGMERFTVLFFIALSEKNAEKISENLHELCLAYQKQGYPVEKIDKCFAGEIHGLYRLVRFFDENLFEKVKMPQHDSFFTDFEAWQKQNGYPKGSFFYEYPPEMAYMNAILLKKLPIYHIFPQKSGAKIEFLPDKERFLEEFVKG